MFTSHDLQNPKAKERGAEVVICDVTQDGAAEALVAAAVKQFGNRQPESWKYRAPNDAILIRLNHNIIFILQRRGRKVCLHANCVGNNLCFGRQRERQLC